MLYIEISNLNLFKYQRFNFIYIYVYIYINIYPYSIYRGKSPITDPLLIPTPSHISVTIIYIKIVYIYTLTISNLIIHMNKYFVF